MARILIVDDSPFSRRLLRALLEKGGHEVSEASDGLSGLESYAIGHPDVVLLDLTMQGVPGMEVLEQMRQVDPQARILIASADIQEATRTQASEHGAQGFVNKPFVAPDVLARIEEVLAGRPGW